MSFDTRITKWLNGIPKGNRDIWFFVSIYGLLAFPLYFLGFWVANGHGFVHLVFFVGIVILATILGAGLQAAVKRPRPTFMHTDYVPHFKKYSWPSIHSLTAFAMATAVIVLQYEQNGYSWIFLCSTVALLLMAKLIAISRIMVGVHYYGDILAGGIFGVALGLLAFLV